MKISKAKIFLICCLVFIAGIAIASFLPIELIQYDLRWFTGIMACSVLLILFWRYKRIRISALIGLFLFLGFWRYAIGLPVNSPDKIWYYNGETVAMEGMISNELDIRDKNQKLEINVGAIRKTSPQPFPSKEEGVYKVSGKILVTTDLYPVYNYGDKLEITCDLQAPEQFQGFAYDRYLARYDIYSVCYYPRITLTPGPFPAASPAGEVSWFYAEVFKLKDKLREKINQGLNEPTASLAKAIILGDKKGITDDLREIFSQAGISHIVAISGMHISILAAMVMGLLLSIGLARRYAFYLASLFLIVYIILIGMPASAMRAGLMGFLVLLALNLGRLNKLTNSLVLAAAILLLINPKLLRDDIGFQLSFLAVLGIAYVYPLLNDILDKIKIPKFKGVRDLFIITIAAQAFTLPIIAYNFSQISIIAPLANLLVLWTLPFLMICTITAIGLCFLIPGLSVVFFLPSWLLLEYIIMAPSYLVKIPYSYIEINYIWLGWLIIYYLISGWIIYRIKKINVDS